MRFLADEPGAPDDDILNAANAEARVLITGDHDFGEMVIRRRLGLHGVLLLELDRLTNATEAEVWRTSSPCMPTGSPAILWWSSQAAFGCGRCGRESLEAAEAEILLTE